MNRCSPITIDGTVPRCPVCHAEAGDPCIGYDLPKGTWVHHGRIAAAIAHWNAAVDDREVQ